MNTTSTRTEFASCSDLLKYIDFPSELPYSLLESICQQAASDNSSQSIILQNYCCQNVTETAIDYDLIKKIVTQNCHNNNLTDDVRREFCQLTNLSSPTTTMNVQSYTLVSILLFSLLGPIGLLSNLMIIALVLKRKKLRNSSGYFICNLAIADLLYIVGTMIYLIIHLKNINVQYNESFYMVFSSFDVMIGSASLLYITAVSIERVIAVTKPLLYPLILTKQRAKRAVIYIWIYCFVLFDLFFARYWIKNEEYAEVLFFLAVSTSFVIPCIIVMIAYVKIGIIAVKSIHSEKKILKSISMALLGKSISENNKVVPLRPVRFREIKIAFNLAIMTTPFVLGWGYYMIYSIYEVVTEEVHDGIVNFVLNFLPFIICCINPVSYITFTRSLRKETMQAIRSPFTKLSLRIRRESSISSTLL